MILLLKFLLFAFFSYSSYVTLIYKHIAVEAKES